MTENVKVAVRVRPFNGRESKRGAKAIIAMDGTTTNITNPADGKTKSFTFDHSYWSHDGYTEDEDGTITATSDTYDSQQKVYDDIGNGVLQNAYDGYNTSLFAYGQTGAGKSYSMVGYGKNRGIIPIAFEELFKKIDANGDPNVKYQVTFSMLEVYMEQVTDLLSNAPRRKGGMKIRENTKKGLFYVENLSKVPVGSYDEIDARMQQGTKARTVAATKMNATSSRAHTVVTLIFETITTTDGNKSTKSSEVNLIDLAGSERADSAGTTGQGLKEGTMINKSLSALGNVISALATGKKAPFRDSVLTKLLQNSLGGNAKTVMIAALSPADMNYDETLSTLRYADRAKQIKTKAAVNENPTDKLIRELKEENERIRSQLESGVANSAAFAPAEVEGKSEKEIERMRREMEAEIRAQLATNEAQVVQMDDQDFETRLAKVREEWEAQKAAEEEASPNVENARANPDSKRRKKDCHLINLNEDPQLSGMIVVYFEGGSNVIGRKKARKKKKAGGGGGGGGTAAAAAKKAGAKEVSILMAGLSMQDLHAEVTVLKDGTVAVDKAVAGSEAKILVNGKHISGRTVINHNDRVLFGEAHLYVFKNPKEAREQKAARDAAKQSPLGTAPPPATKVDWELASQEIALNQGMKSKAFSQIISHESRDKVVELLPMVSEVNAIFKQLKIARTVEIAVLSGPIAGLNKGESRVNVKVKNLMSGNNWMIPRDDFVTRRYKMQELLQQANDKEDAEDAKQAAEDQTDGLSLPGGGMLGLGMVREPSMLEVEATDPFNIEKGEVIVGAATVFLQSLCYNVEFEDSVNIVDYKGRNEGKIEVGIFPTDAAGKVLPPEDVLTDATDLIGKPLRFVLRVSQGTIKKRKFCKGVYIKFKNELSDPGAEFTTPEVKGPRYDFKYDKHFEVAEVDQETLQWLATGTISLFVWGHQSDDLTMEELINDTEEIEHRRRNSVMNPINLGAGAADGELEDLREKVAEYMEVIEKCRSAHESYMKKQVTPEMALDVVGTAVETVGGVFSAPPKMRHSAGSLTAITDGGVVGLPGLKKKKKSESKPSAGKGGEAGDAKKSGACSVM